MKHPMQPIIEDEDGVLRFKKNLIVEYLLESEPTDMNKIAAMNFPDEDRAQFAQLIGYSESGYYGLSYVKSTPEVGETWLVSIGNDPYLRKHKVKAISDKVVTLENFNTDLWIAIEDLEFKEKVE